MDNTFKVLLGAAILLGSWKLLRIGGQQKADREAREHRSAKSASDDAKATRKSISQRR